MFKTRTFLYLLAVPLLAVVIACGGDKKDDSSSSSSSGSGTGSSQSSGSGSSGSSGSSSSGSSSSGDDRGSALSLENCKEYTNFAAASAAAFAPSSNSSTKLDKSALDKMVKAAPKEIRADLEIVVGALVSYFDVLEKAGLTGDPSKIDPAKLQAAQKDLEKAAEKFEDKKVQEAGERIEAFFEKNCK